MNTQERVARALAEIIGTPAPWDELNREARSVWRSYAAAAIAAHKAALADEGLVIVPREPTEAMLNAARGDFAGAELLAIAFWQAMIKALEAEPPEAG